MDNSFVSESVSCMDTWNVILLDWFASKSMGQDGEDFFAPLLVIALQLLTKIHFICDCFCTRHFHQHQNLLQDIILIFSLFHMFKLSKKDIIQIFIMLVPVVLIRQTTIRIWCIGEEIKIKTVVTWCSTLILIESQVDTFYLFNFIVVQIYIVYINIIFTSNFK